MGRRKPRNVEVLETLARQGVQVEAIILPRPVLDEREFILYILERIESFPCGHCGTPIRKREECERDHKIALKQVAKELRKEYDQPWNWWYLCTLCHDEKTFKRGLAGLAIGSDAALNAKIRRREKKQAQACQGTTTSPEISRKRWGTSKLRSAGFQKRPEGAPSPWPSRRDSWKKAPASSSSSGNEKRKSKATDGPPSGRSFRRNSKLRGSGLPGSSWK